MYVIMPSAVVNKINAVVRRALAEPAVQDKLIGLGGVPRDMTPEQFAKFVHGEIECATRSYGGLLSSCSNHPSGDVPSTAESPAVGRKVGGQWDPTHRTAAVDRAGGGERNRMQARASEAKLESSKENAVPTRSSERGKQLGEFLRYLRDNSTPQDVGLVASGRRRTPGLRREEVADLVGVSADWYTWLEQGRDVQASETVVKRLSQIFRLNSDQHAYLFRLARPQPYLVENVATTVPDSLVDMINSLHDRPAYIRNSRWDILANNAPYGKIWGFSVAPERRNVIRMLFLESGYRSITENYDLIVEQVVARFRDDRSRNPEDELSTELVRELQAKSPEFRELWVRYRITEASPYPLEINHPTGGRFKLDRVPLRPELVPGLTVVVYLPVNEESQRATSSMFG